MLLFVKVDIWKITASIAGSIIHMLICFLVSGMYLGTVIPYDVQMVWRKGMLEIAHNYFNNSSDMDQICESDKKIILLNNMDLMLNFVQSISFREHRPTAFIEIIDKIQKFDHGLNNTIFQVFNELNFTPDGNPERGIQYKQVYTSPWAPNILLEQRHEFLVQKMKHWAIDTEPTSGSKVDCIMIFYLCHILLYSTDFVKLQMPNRISSIQDKYLKMLHRYLKFKYDQEATKKLGNGIMILSFAREANEIRQKRLPV